ncbi:enoyl-CoA hydratase [Nocardia sp. alder85J]|uniref:enoyl-CoA hydratase n=1 Tax=Nocardia sp. alder85J TaxID=2862949 RepID=UPI001CD35092|nr:enoyl-CoA hydratase [Nocardia sp. alder85J]MCX4093283.1 enoyl-CoA hydratase [Nocardia sp. alder85J]
MLGVSRDGDVVTIELQRPQRRNALNEELVALLHEAVTAAAADARVIVLTGAGRIFCAGADLDGAHSEQFLRALMAMLHAVENAPVPVISAIHGGALGAGVQLTLASDLRVLSPDAFVGIPAAKLGVSLDNWTVRRLAALIGGGPARTMLLGAELIPAADAYTFGYANRIGTPADAQAWAKQIATLAPLSLRHLKMVLNGGDGAETPEQAAALRAAWESADAEEAMVARREKRAPKFVGR